PHYDTGIRCPLVVAGGPVRQAAPVDRLSCSLDLYPTFCEWAGVERTPPCEGKSFAALCAGGRSPGWPEVAVSIGSVDSVVTADGWRLTRFSKGNEGQIFNLRDDPGEQHNLYHNPEYAEKKTQLLERLVKVRMLPREVLQYRNLPDKDGRKWSTDSGKTWAVTPVKPSPWLEDGPKPEWHGKD
ncbi:MAG: hypothetical protein M1457_02790, partial [bacterium]|nr:hypothetical protein [bacterium]